MINLGINAVAFYTDDILDRIVHQSIRIELYGGSLRKKQKATTEIEPSIL